MLFIKPEVGICNYLFDLDKVNALQPHRHNPLVQALEGELVERRSFFIDFYPAVTLEVGQDLVVCMETVLFIAKADAGHHTADVEVKLLASLGLEALVDIVEDAEAILATALEVLLIVVCYAVHLVPSLDRLYNFPAFAVDKLDLTFVESQADVVFAARSVNDFELNLRLENYFQIVSTQIENVAFDVLDKHSIVAQILDEV
jgi:hypothetical protein